MPGRSPQADFGAPGRPKKSLAQHFLVNRGVVEQILRAAELGPADTVVEVGPGRGILTYELVKLAGKVIAIEKDDALASILRVSLEKWPNATVIAGDALDVDMAQLPRLSHDEPYKVVANLPYNVATAILRRFLTFSHKPELMVVMVQREVGERMVAGPGKMTYSGVLVQLYGRPSIVCRVSPGSFRPRPRVESVVVRIDVSPKPRVDVEEPEQFIAVARAGFSAPRKQLHNSLAVGLHVKPHEAEALLREAGIETSRRAQTLTLEEWARLYRTVAHARSGAGQGAG